MYHLRCIHYNTAETVAQKFKEFFIQEMEKIPKIQLALLLARVGPEDQQLWNEAATVDGKEIAAAETVNASSTDVEKSDLDSSSINDGDCDRRKRQHE
jgi:hypothetical protein